eukprot:6179423-Pleurochrysis_carterae.AAC.1
MLKSLWNIDRQRGDRATDREDSPNNYRAELAPPLAPVVAYVRRAPLIESTRYYMIAALRRGSDGVRSSRHSPRRNDGIRIVAVCYYRAKRSRFSWDTTYSSL